MINNDISIIASDNISIEIEKLLIETFKGFNIGSERYKRNGFGDYPLTILVFIASSIASGIVYDLIKNKVMSFLRNDKIDNNASIILKIEDKDIIFTKKTIKISQNLKIIEFKDGNELIDFLKSQS